MGPRRLDLPVAVLPLRYDAARGPMRILLTGGTGFIGSALARAVRERRDDVVIVSRGNNGDVTWDGIEGEVGRVEAIVPPAGEPVAGGRWTAARLERIRTSRVDTTALIARA